MRRPETSMRAWLSKASAVEKRAVAKAAGTSVIYLYHIAAGRRQASADLAQRLAAGKVRGAFPGWQTPVFVEP